MDLMGIHFLFNPNAILYHKDIHFPLHLPVIHHLINLSPCSTHLLNIPIQSLNLRLDFHIMIDLPCWIPILRRFRTLCADIPLAPLRLPVEALKPRGLTDGPITNSTTFTSSGSAYFDYYTTRQPARHHQLLHRPILQLRNARPAAPPPTEWKLSLPRP